MFRKWAIFRAYIAAWLLTVSVAWGCAGERDLAQLNKRATAAGGVHINTIPAVEFGRNGSGGKGGFGYPVGATRLSNGTIVVADLKDNKVRYFSNSGHLLASVGRTGADGLDSFRAVVWVGQCASDTVFVWDSLKRRIVVLDRSGRYVREFRPPGEAAEIECGHSRVLALLMSPTRLELPRLDGTAPPQFVSLRFVNTSGDTLRSIDGIRSAENRPLGRGTFFTLSGQRAYVGLADSAPIFVYSLRGERLASLPIPREAPRTSTRQHYEEAVSQLVRGLTKDSEREHARKFFLKIPMPRFLPPYSGLFAAEPGILWENVSALGDSETVLRAMDANGVRKGELHIPVSLRVFEMGNDYLLGAYRLKSGDEHVVLYRLQRDAGTNSG